RKSRTVTRPTVQSSLGTSGGPTTRGTVKKSLDQILERSRQNTLKRRRITRQTVLEEESLSSPVVDLECGTSSHSKDGSSESEKPVGVGGGVGKPVEEPGAPVVRSKRKHTLSKSCRGKRPVAATVGDDVKVKIANIRKQKVLGGRIFDPDIAEMQGMQELIEM
ncbi:hypothetical protein HAX54_016970, partial [Datura stramonium]|nr:hypothetical protein [Datura stramonium]